MTRARTASSGMGSLAAIQPLLDAVLMLCVSLVQAAATTLRMILNRRRPDWHRQATHEGLPQATSGNHYKDPSGLPGSILSLAPLIAPQQAQPLLPRQGGGPKGRGRLQQQQQQQRSQHGPPGQGQGSVGLFKVARAPRKNREAACPGKRCVPPGPPRSGRRGGWPDRPVPGCRPGHRSRH